MKKPKTVVVVKAVDWAIMAEQVSADHDFRPIKGWVCGFKVKETGDALTLTQQWFTGEKQVRQTITIPLVNILERYDFKTGGEKDGVTT